MTGVLGALSLAFIDSINLLLIAVIVAVGILAPRAGGRFGKITGLLIAGDWLGVAGLALIMLLIFDSLGEAVQRIVNGPIFGIVLIATGVLTGLLALRGGDNSALVNRILAPLRSPNPLTVLTGFILGLATIPLYATVALSLPTLTALLVAWVRAKPESAAGRAFDWARANPQTVSLAATWAVSFLLIVLGVVHLL